MYVNIEGGKKATMARYYKDKIYNDTERSEIANHHMEIMQNKTEKRAIKQSHQEWLNRKQNIKAAFEAAEKKSQDRDKL